MFKISAIVAVTASTLLAAAPRAHAATIVAGGGAIAEFDQVSADGCTHTFGEIAVLQATKGAENANGLYVTGMQEDLCGGGNGNGFAGYATGSFAVVGLGAAHFKGSLTAPSYSGGADVVVDLDLWWMGWGKITPSGNVFHDGNQISFQWGVSRAATTIGRFDLGGEPATVNSAQLVAEVSGSINF